MTAKTRFLCAAMIAVALPSAGRAADPPASIKSILTTCNACHGPKGVSSLAQTPSLAAQPNIFTQYQLVFMREGGRKPGAMAAVVKTLTDDQIRDLGAWYESLPPPPALKTGEGGDEARAMAIIKPRHCDSCHKEDFSGQGETGRLAGQRPDYLIKALEDFRSGERRGRGMGAMMEVSVTLKDDDIQTIATYLAHKP
ncbi:MAG: c-type cytochrome [Proteobacteria bacterium]|nr:c-type cytochrome [Pseudomonadota bacterium]